MLSESFSTDQQVRFKTLFLEIFAKRFSAFAVLTACVGTLLLTGCAPTRYKLDMTQYEHYNNESSYARNLARLQGYDRALTDTKVPKDMVSDWGAVELGADLLVNNWLYNLKLPRLKSGDSL